MNTFPDPIIGDRTVQVSIVIKGKDLEGSLTALQGWFPGTKLYNQETPLPPEILEDAIQFEKNMSDLESLEDLKDNVSRFSKIFGSKWIESLVIRRTIHNKNYPTPNVKEYQRNPTNPIFSHAKAVCNNINNMLDRNGVVMHYTPPYKYTSFSEDYYITVAFVVPKEECRTIKQVFEQKSSLNLKFFLTKYSECIDLFINDFEAIQYVLTTPEGSNSEYSTQHRNTHDIISYCTRMMDSCHAEFLKNSGISN